MSNNEQTRRESHGNILPRIERRSTNHTMNQSIFQFKFSYRYAIATSSLCAGEVVSLSTSPKLKNKRLERTDLVLRARATRRVPNLFVSYSSRRTSARNTSKRTAPSGNGSKRHRHPSQFCPGPCLLYLPITFFTANGFEQNILVRRRRGTPEPHHQQR
jgi:hypothetical protein